MQYIICRQNMIDLLLYIVADYDIYKKVYY